MADQKKSKDDNPILNTSKQSPKIIRQRLGAELRAIYDEVLDEPLPDEMIEFLKTLDSKDSEQRPSSDQDSLSSDD